MLFDVNGRYIVQYLDDDWNLTSRTIGVTGQTIADTEDAARTKVIEAIRHYHTPCWSLEISALDIRPAVVSPVSNRPHLN